MPRKRTPLPVIVSRWFEDGHSFAYSPDVDLRLLKAVADRLSVTCQKGLQKDLRRHT